MATIPSNYAYFYNDDDGDRVYDADSMIDWLFPFFTTGVFNGGMQVLSNDDMTATVQTGYVNIEGKTRNFFNTTDVSFDTAHSQYDRIDIVVARRDDAERNITIAVVKGEASANPVAPTLTRNTEIWELQLCAVEIAAGATALSQANFTDTRMDDDLCGWVAATVEEIKFEQIKAQFDSFLAQYRASLEGEAEDIIDALNAFEQSAEASFNAWFNALKTQFSEDAVGALLSAIENLDERVAYLEEHGGSGGTVTITGISVTTPPTKTSYNAGDTLDLTGMVVKVNYSDGNSTTINSSDLTTVPASGATLTTQNTSVAISYVHGENTYGTTQTITVEKSLANVTWADGTWEEIAAMFSAHKAGTIDLYQLWNIGDKRTIHIDYLQSISSQVVFENVDIELVLADKNPTHMNKDALFVVTQKNGFPSADIWSQYFSTPYANSTASSWLNTNYYEALPVELRNLIKESTHTLQQYIANSPNADPSGYELWTGDDKIFVPSVYDVGMVSDDDIPAWEYYNEPDNRIKKVHDSDTSYGWWMSDSFAGSTGWIPAHRFLNTNGVLNHTYNAADFYLYIPSFCIG